MNKQDMGVVLRTVGRYVRRLMEGSTAELADLRRKVDSAASGVTDVEARSQIAVLKAKIEVQDLAPLVLRVKALEEARPAVVNVLKGDRGEDAPPPTDEQVGEQVARYLQQHPPARGEPGASVKGEPGEKGEPGPAPTVEAIAEQVARYLQQHPPQRGEPGAKGDQGDAATIDHDELVKLLDAACERRMAVELLSLERRFNEHVRAFEAEARAALAAMPIPKNGTDGVGFEDLEFDYDGERTVRAVFKRAGEVLKEFCWRFPVPIDRGYWKEGLRAQKGDAITHDGTLWLALRDTSEKPSLTADKDWRIGARKGRDAK